jgi:hypothetical protein
VEESDVRDQLVARGAKVLTSFSILRSPNFTDADHYAGDLVREVVQYRRDAVVELGKMVTDTAQVPSVQRRMSVARLKCPPTYRSGGDLSVAR